MLTKWSHLKGKTILFSLEVGTTLGVEHHRVTCVVKEVLRQGFSWSICPKGSFKDLNTNRIIGKAPISSRRLGSHEMNKFTGEYGSIRGSRAFVDSIKVTHINGVPLKVLFGPNLTTWPMVALILHFASEMVVASCGDERLRNMVQNVVRYDKNNDTRDFLSILQLCRTVKIENNTYVKDDCASRLFKLK